MSERIRVGSEMEYSTDEANRLLKAVASSSQSAGLWASGGGYCLKNGGRLYCDVNSTFELTTPVCYLDELPVQESVGGIIMGRIAQTERLPLLKLSGTWEPRHDGSSLAFLSAGYHLNIARQYRGELLECTDQQLKLVRVFMATVAVWTGGGIVTEGGGYATSQKAFAIGHFNAKNNRTGASGKKTADLIADHDRYEIRVFDGLVSPEMTGARTALAAACFVAGHCGRIQEAFSDFNEVNTMRLFQIQSPWERNRRAIDIQQRCIDEVVDYADNLHPNDRVIVVEAAELALRSLGYIQEAGSWQAMAEAPEGIEWAEKLRLIERYRRAKNRSEGTMRKGVTAIHRYWANYGAGPRFGLPVMRAQSPLLQKFQDVNELPSPLIPSEIKRIELARAGRMVDW